MLGAMLLCAALTARASAPPAHACAFTAFVEETDPAGLNVRDAPSSSAHVIGRLPPVWDDPSTGLRVRVRVDITAASGGWFRIRNAADDEDLTGQPARPTYAGEGWVSGRKLVVKSQATIGRLGPGRDSPEAMWLPDDYAFDSDALVTASRPLDCVGAWARIDVDESQLPKALSASLRVSPAARAGAARGHAHAWVDQICGIQETACEGP